MMTFIFETLGLLVLGVIVHVLDRVYGLKFGRVWWNLTHSPKSKKTKDAERGFIFGRPVSARVVLIGTIMLGLEIALFMTTHGNLFVGLLWMIWATFWTVIGTYLGPYGDKALGFATVSLAQLDDIEARIARKETTLGAEMRGAATTVRRRVFDDEPLPAPTATPSVPPPVPPVEPVDDGREAFNRFVGKTTKK